MKTVNTAIGNTLTLTQWLEQATALLTPLLETGPVPADAKQEARRILLEVLDINATTLMLYPERELTASQLLLLGPVLTRRLTGEPLAHILGYWYFWDFKLAVAPCTLIPRPDTELLVEQALALPLPAKAQVLDLGTGTGAIALALAKEKSAWAVTGVDLEPDAVALAKQNVELLALTNCQIKQSSWFDALEGQQFDLIVSNPPYIDAQDPHLALGDVRFEPDSALIAPEQGLADIRHICTQAPQFLTPSGWLWLEHGYQQSDVVQQILTAAGFTSVQSVKDYGDQWRISGGQLPA
ncbi:protein-(glutamine-N5) methyltransferase, release factor-specific [Rheinheimera sp. A13L]|uniref:peptide chain release factor N(5)-glutamine methyltransferase n=1 Tax=Rheinheimera sp. A13L TaxID=506534 RepID=UPI0002124A86|nr:peptide chain release factor N(5)-glutamine methyltransferase [Rheinheimera sp. A13L]EGM77127.1 protein-(glutamine-N5) methyltransferase, release factor-specific [Rheinheimera sp. A13L]